MRRLARTARGALGSRFVRESSVLQVASLATAASNVAGSVLLAHLLGARELGLFYIAGGMYALLWFFLNLGLAPVATMRIAGAVRGGDPEGTLPGSIGVFLRLSLALAAVAIGVGVLTWSVVPEAWFARVFDEDSGRIMVCAALLTLGPLFEAPRNICIAALQGERRMLALARVELGQEFGRLGFVVVGAVLARDAVGPTLGLVAGNAVGAVLSMDAYRRERRAEGSILPPLLPCLFRGGVSHGRVLKEGVKVGLVRNMDSIGFETIPTLLLGAFGNRTWVAYLRIAQRFGALLRILVQGINRTALPVLSQLAHVKDVGGLRRTYWKASALSGGMVSLGMVVVLPLLPFVIHALYPPDFWEPVFLLVLILSPGIAVASFSVANDVFYLVTQQMRVAILVSALGLFVNSGLMWACTVRWPEEGTAIGLSIACLWSLVHMGYAGTWLHRHAPAAPAPAA